MHAESEHGLQIQLATALRERDAARAEAAGYRKAAFDNAKQGADAWAARDAAESERDALRGEVKRLRDVLKALLAFPGSNATDHEKCDEECPYERARAALAGGGDRG